MLDALGNLGDFLGGIGVVVTLGYLALQIRQNTQALRRDSYQNLLNHIAALNARVADRGFAEMAVSAREGLAVLDEADQLRLSNWVMAVFRHYQNAFEQYRGGILSDEQWEQLSGPISALLISKGCYEAFLRLEDRFSSEFRAWVRGRRDELGDQYGPPHNKALQLTS